jgi:hypothetical protein
MGAHLLLLAGCGKARGSRILTVKAVGNDKNKKVLAIPVNSCRCQIGSKPEFLRSLLDHRPDIPYSVY